MHRYTLDLDIDIDIYKDLAISTYVLHINLLLLYY